MRVVVAVGLLLASGCGPPPPPPRPARAAPAAAAPTAAVADAGPPLSEVQARALIAGRLRGAGLRVVADVAVELPGGGAVTLDGFDPERRIGYEYVAAGEAGTDLSAAERDELAAGAAGQVLVVDAAAAAEVEARAAAFVSSWARADAGL